MERTFLNLKEITEEKFYIDHIDVMDDILSNISTVNANMNFAQLATFHCDLVTRPKAKHSGVFP